MVRPLWKDPHSSIRRGYGLGTIVGAVADWEWFGHSGSFPGTLSSTYALKGRDLAVSVLTNSLDGLAGVWVEGAVQILRTFASEGPAAEATRGWAGRFWSMWGPMDLVALQDRVKVAQPAFVHPFLDASEIEVSGDDPDRGTIALAGGFGSHGEPAVLTRDADGRIREVRLGGMRLVPVEDLAAELRETYPAVRT
jgi:D-alanyl-D-alanine carboxypeptidase